MAAFLPDIKFQAFDSNGDPLSGGKVYTYVPGTTTPRATYPTLADADNLTNANANPVVLDSRGEANICFNSTLKIVLKDANDVTIWTVDNITPSGQGETIFDEYGVAILKFEGVVDAVNEITINNAATAGAPAISATGTDSNINLDLSAKGTGVVSLEGQAVTVGYGATGPGAVRLLEDSDNGTNYIGLAAPSAVTTSVTFTFPNGDGTSGQVLKTNASGTLSWGGHDDLSGFVANEHIDWTAASSNFSTTGTVDLGGATSFELPNGTSPTTDAAGEIALDTNGDGSSVTHGVLKVYDGTNQLYVFPVDGYPSTDGDVITYDQGNNKATWSSSPVAGDWVFISAATASSSATVDFTGLSSSYKTYKIFFDSTTPATDQVSLYIVVGTGAGPTYDTGGNYQTQYSANGSTTFVGNRTAGNTQIPLNITGTQQGNAAGEYAWGEVTIHNPASSTPTNLETRTGFIDENGSIVQTRTVAQHGTAVAVTAIRFLYSSGNIAVGNFYLYGLIGS